MIAWCMDLYSPNFVAGPCSWITFKMKSLSRMLRHAQLTPRASLFFPSFSFAGNWRSHHAVWPWRHAFLVIYTCTDTRMRFFPRSRWNFFRKTTGISHTWCVPRGQHIGVGPGVGSCIGWQYVEEGKGKLARFCETMFLQRSSEDFRGCF